jgi:hypothetical protein
MERKDLFQLWMSLKSEIQELAAIVQNSNPLGYTPADKEQWELRVLQANLQFNEAYRETCHFLDSHPSAPSTPPPLLSTSLTLSQDEHSLTQDENLSSQNQSPIDLMVDRFLQWKLPEDFNPDGGISFKATYNEGTPFERKYEPRGTNLFTGTQARAMLEYVLDSNQFPQPSQPPSLTALEIAQLCLQIVVTGTHNSSVEEVHRAILTIFGPETAQQLQILLKESSGRAPLKES